MSRKPVAEALNDYYRLFTPYHKPLRLSDSWYRLAARVECVKCGQSKTQILRVPRFRSSIVMTAPLPMPDPAADKIVTSFMVRACDNLVGCWKNCNCQPDTDTKTNQAIHRPQCAYLTGCGNRGIHPCSCGWVRNNHMAGCHVGAVKRTGSFAVAAVRSTMIGLSRRGLTKT